uniref:Histidine-rich protein n=1 Tax=Solanum tuberosum TaxID=4113 RepID=M1CK70_SOLTU
MPFYRLLRMGCGVSKIDANGVATPNRSILPNFPTRKKQSNKCNIPPKTQPMLLMPENDDRLTISALKCDVDLNYVAPKAYKDENDEKRVAKIRTMVEEAEKNDEKGRLLLHEDEAEEEDDGHDDDDQRAIKKVHAGEEDGNAFPGSPSFRVYFTDKDVETKKINDGMCYNKVGLKDVTPVATTISSTKESESESESSVGKEEKKEIRKRSTFRKVLPKNLLNVRSSSNSSTRSTDHHYHHKVAS